MPRACAASRCPASPTRTRTRSSARCAGRTQRGGGSFWTWREDMYALAATMTPDTCFELARRAPTPRCSQAGITTRRRVRLPALQRRADRRGERDRHPAHAARRLLPRGRLRRAAERRAAPLQRRRRRALGRARVGRSEGAKVGAAIHSVRAVPAGPDPDRRRVGAGPAAALPPLRAARRERGLPRRPRLHADGTARRARRARPGLAPPSTRPT